MSDDYLPVVMARGFADLGLRLARAEQRIEALTERLAMFDGDIEKLQKHVGAITTRPPLIPIPPSEIT